MLTGSSTLPQQGTGLPSAVFRLKEAGLADEEGVTDTSAPESTRNRQLEDASVMKSRGELPTAETSFSGRRPSRFPNSEKK